MILILKSIGVPIKVVDFVSKMYWGISPHTKPNNTGFNCCCVGIRVYYRYLPIINPGIHAYPVGVKKIKKPVFV